MNFCAVLAALATIDVDVPLNVKLPVNAWSPVKV
jgi:hypothetical protein